MGKKGRQFNSYISLSVEKMYVRKNDGALQTVFSSRRTSYPVAKFSADFAGNNIKINKITESTAISSRAGSADLISGWEILDRIPYAFTKPTLQLIIASNADSNIKQSISMFNAVTSAVPDIQVSSSVVAASAIASAFDTYFLAPDRVTNAMKTEYEFPLTAGELCDGAYIAFAARRPESYAKYVSSDLAVNGNVATFKGAPINEISHAIIRLKITDRYYDTASSALDDTNKKWAAFFNEMATAQTQLFTGVTREKIDQFKSTSSSNFILGEEYLKNDPYLLSKEKLEILALVKSNYLTKLAVLEQSIAAPTPIPAPAIEILNEEVQSKFNANVDFPAIIEIVDSNHTATLPKVPTGLSASLRSALSSTGAIIDTRVAEAQVAAQAEEIK